MNKKIKVIESQIQKEYKKLALIKDEEAAKLRAKIVNKLQKELGAQLRSE